jgi:hypothetical protein
VECLEPKPLSGPLIQSVFDHSQLLIGDSFHAPLLWNVLPQQIIEVLVAAALPTAIRIGKVGLDAKGLIDDLAIGKLFAVVYRQRFHPGVQGQEPGFNRSTHQISRLVGHLGQHSKATLAFYQRNGGLFVSRANDSVTFPVAHLLAIFNVAWSLADRAAARDLPTPVTPAEKFATDGAAAPAQKSGDLPDGLFGFQEAVNLVSFFSAEVLVN